MLHIISPKVINSSPERERLLSAGIKGGWNYALDHAWLLNNIETYIESNKLSAPLILDVGCGNSMLHPFLENELSSGIIGIDRIDGLCPHPGRTNIMDFCTDFNELSVSMSGMADIVYWLSSIEHNSIPDQMSCVESSMRVLKPGGLFLATFGYSIDTNWFEASEQTNLSRADAEEVFGVPWESPPDFNSTVEEYKMNLMDLDSRHIQRYGTTEYEFIVAGARIVKGEPI